MKYLTSILLVAALFAAAGGARADVESVASFAVHGTDIADYNFAVVPPRGNWIPRVKYIQAESDTNAARITFHTAAAPLAISVTNLVNATTVTVQNASWALTNGNEILTWRPSTATGFRYVIGVAATNWIQIAAGLTNTLVPGDLIYKVTNGNSLPGYGTTDSPPVTYSGDPVWQGESGKPLLIDLDSDAAGEINAVTGDYIRAP